jgi:outer membrane protein assembly factor BamB
VKRILLGAGGVLVLLVLALGLFVADRLRQPADVRGSSTAEFVTTADAVPPAPPEPGIAWPTYGYSANRLRVGPGSFHPPYRRIWRFRAQQLLEFPPAIGYGRLFFVNAKGTVFAIGAKTGKRAWKRAEGRCQASSPALDRHLAYVTFLRRCNGKAKPKRLDGLLAAYSVGNGKVRWWRTIGQSESSPVVYRGFVYVGDWSGRVYCFAGRTGKLVWTFKTGGKIKSAVAISGNRLFVGSYDHHVYALRVDNGKLIWKASAQSRGFLSRGTFYAGPAVAYGRVYIGSTDGKVYSFGAASGTTRWVTNTGNWVYSSPAVWKQRVYSGSYSKKLFCFDAATGAVKWTFKANGKISGSPTIVDGIVYFATLAGRTYGVDALTGRQVWTYPDGEYTPVVSDADHLYVVGRARIYAFVNARVLHDRRPRSSAATGRKASKAPKRSAR